jgi:aromatic-L-amino-acid decarboxylase
VDPSDFRRNGYALVDWISEYLDHSERFPVLARVKPGEILTALPREAPEDAESFGAIMADFERVLVPGLTHWNHPSFFAYFAITGSAPGALADFLSAALNQQAMLWATSPAATELEAVTLGWLRRLIGLPDAFEGVIYDTASVSTLHALGAAREAAVPDVRTRGLARSDLPPLRVYCSEEAHSSVDKAVITLGLGHQALSRIAVDDQFRMRPDALLDAIRSDRLCGYLPLAVVATVGTTSTTSIDPVSAIAAVCQDERLWLHVDAAYGGAAAILPSHAHVLDGAARADSLVVNPHKWLFTPFDLSAFYCRRMDVLRAAFAFAPEYLRTASPPSSVPSPPPAAAPSSPSAPSPTSLPVAALPPFGTRNLMDTGVQLGRRFRALKLWFVLRMFGVRSIREHLTRHLALAQQFASWVDADPDFERLAPVPLSVVCFRWKPTGDTLSPDQIDRANEQLLAAVNQSGQAYLSHTRIRGRFALRMAIGHLRTEEQHVRQAWELLCRLAK